MTQRLLFADRFTAWKQFHADNPQVFELFLRFAREAKASGRGKFSAHAIGERLRWYVRVETRSQDGLKLNDHHLPYFARLAMELHPDELGGLFETRDARFDSDPQEILAAHLSITDAELSEAAHG